MYVPYNTWCFEQGRVGTEDLQSRGIHNFLSLLGEQSFHCTCKKVMCCSNRSTYCFSQSCSHMSPFLIDTALPPTNICSCIVKCCESKTNWQDSSRSAKHLAGQRQYSWAKTAACETARCTFAPSFFASLIRLFMYHKAQLWEGDHERICNNLGYERSYYPSRKRGRIL